MTTIIAKPKDARLADAALEAGFTHILAPRGHTPPGRLTHWARDGYALLKNSRRVGTWITISDAQDQARAMRPRARGHILVIEAKDWTIIPLENLVARHQGRNPVFAVARTAQEARVLAATLERGVDGLILEIKSPSQLKRMATLLTGPRREPHRLVTATITRVTDAGVGDRVLLDTSTLLKDDEGMLVGSTSQGFFLVAAETLENPYVKPRPFRVNAGAVHCYLLNGETTLYLSEAQAGHRIEAVQRNGHRRTVVLGRSKTERRPLLLIEAEAQGRRHSVMLQNAETVRLMRPRGRPLSVSRLAPGDKVLMRLETAARHFGMKIQEQLEET